MLITVWNRIKAWLTDVGVAQFALYVILFVTGCWLIFQFSGRTFDRDEAVLAGTLVWLLGAVFKLRTRIVHSQRH
jgi:predicted secreted protein